jgi:sn-glycerol 3-phosphate transport system substrate-binding protein
MPFMIVGINEMMNKPDSGNSGKIAIKIWLNDYPFPGFLDPMKDVTRKFNAAHPDYEVEIVGHDFRALPVRVAREVGQHGQPDVMEYFYTSTRQAIDMIGPDGESLFTPVGKAIGGRSEILGEPVLLGDMVPAARDHFTYMGEQMSFPPTASTVVLYANMSILGAAGVHEVPRTWLELSAACRAIAGLPGGPAYQVTWPNNSWIFLQAIAQQGGLVADRDNGRSGCAEKVALDSAEMLEFVTWWQRLHRDGAFYYSGKRSDWDSCFAAFERQDVAFILSSSVDAGRLLAMGKREGFDVKVARMPYNDEVRFAGNMIGGDSLWLRAGLDEAKRDGALAFMQYIIQPHTAAEWHKINGRLPITRSSADVLEREGWFSQHPDLRVAGEQLEAGDGSPAALGPVVGAFAGIQNELTAAMHDVLSGGAELGPRFGLASAGAQRLLDDYNEYCAGPPRRAPRDLKVAW